MNNWIAKFAALHYKKAENVYVRENFKLVSKLNNRCRYIKKFTMKCFQKLSTFLEKSYQILLNL